MANTTATTTVQTTSTTNAAIPTTIAVAIMAPVTATTSTSTSIKPVTSTADVVIISASTTSVPSSSMSMVTSFVPSSSSSVTVSLPLSTGTTLNQTSSTNITTTPQVIPLASSDGPTSSNSSSSTGFPIAASVIIGVVVGSLMMYGGYKLYVYLYKRKRDEASRTPYPEPRPLVSTMTTVGSSSQGHGRNRRYSEPMMANLDSHSPVTSSGRNAGWGSSMYDINSDRDHHGGDMVREDSRWDSVSSRDHRLPLDHSDGSDTSPHSPLHSRMGTPTPPSSRDIANLNAIAHHHHRQGSKTSLPSLPSTHSRNSLLPPSASFAAPRRIYGSPSSVYNGPQLLSPAVTPARTTGAPHSSRSRIDIIPPLPLAPPPGAIISTDKATLDFSFSSGIGGTATERGGGESWLQGPTLLGQTRRMSSAPEQQRGIRSVVSRESFGGSMSEGPGNGRPPLRARASYGEVSRSYRSESASIMESQSRQGGGRRGGGGGSASGSSRGSGRDPFDVERSPSGSSSGSYVDSSHSARPSPSQHDSASYAYFQQTQLGSHSQNPSQTHLPSSRSHSRARRDNQAGNHTDKEEEQQEEEEEEEEEEVEVRVIKLKPRRSDPSKSPTASEKKKSRTKSPVVRNKVPPSSYNANAAAGVLVTPVRK